MTVFATDVSNDAHGEGAHAYELAYSSRTTPPETMAQAILASAAVSALVLPRPSATGSRPTARGCATSRSGTRTTRPGVELIVSFRYLPTYPRIGHGGARAAAPAARALPEDAAGEGADRRAARGGGARRARRARALGAT